MLFCSGQIYRGNGMETTKTSQDNGIGIDLAWYGLHVAIERHGV